MPARHSRNAGTSRSIIRLGDASARGDDRNGREVAIAKYSGAAAVQRVGALSTTAR
jgi:hypothetical protein